MRLVGLLANLFERLGGDQVPVVEDLHHRLGRTGVDAAAEIAPPHRIQRLADLDVDVRSTMPLDQVAG